MATNSGIPVSFQTTCSYSQLRDTAPQFLSNKQISLVLHEFHERSQEVRSKKGPKK
jgi:hypothetical protein